MKYTVSITPPKVKQIFFTNQAKTAVAIEWDQPVKWDANLISRFYLDGVAGKVTAGSVSGNEAVVLPQIQLGIYVLAVKGMGYCTILKKMTVF